MNKQNKFLVKFNSQNYFCNCFDEITELIVGNENENLYLTNRLLLVEMIRICGILEGTEIEIIDSNSKIMNFKKESIYLNIDDDDSIIKVINELKIATILYLF